VCVHVHLLDILIVVCRLDRLTEDPEQRTFEMNNDSSEEFVINCTELRWSDFEMDLVTPVGVAPRKTVRRSPRARGSCTPTIVTNKKYILPIDIEQHILESCPAP
jgi:hypothetical protein